MQRKTSSSSPAYSHCSLYDSYLNRLWLRGRRRSLVEAILGQVYSRLISGVNLSPTSRIMVASLITSSTIMSRIHICRIRRIRDIIEAVAVLHLPVKLGDCTARSSMRVSARRRQLRTRVKNDGFRAHWGRSVVLG